MLKKIAGQLGKDAFVFGLGNSLTGIVNLMLLPVFTRYLTPKDYGVIAILEVFLFFLKPLGQLGMVSTVFKFYNERPNNTNQDSVTSNAFYVVLLFSALIFACGTWFSNSLSQLLLGEQAYSDAVVVILMTLVFTNIGQIPFSILRSQRKVKIATALNFLKVLIQVSSAYIMIVVFDYKYLGIVYAYLLTEFVVSAIYFGLTINLFKSKISWRIVKELLTYGLPFVPHKMLSFATLALSQWLIRFFLGLELAGLYSVAARFSRPLQVIISSVQYAWVPLKFKIKREAEQSNLIFRDLALLHTLITLFFALFTCVVCMELLPLMVTSDFKEAKNYLSMLLLCEFSFGVYYMYGIGIELQENTGKLPLVSLSNIFVMFMISMATIWYWGGNGVSLARIMGVVVSAFVMIWFANKDNRIDFYWFKLLIYSLSAGAGMYFIQLIQDEGAVIRVVIYLLVLSIFLSLAGRELGLKKAKEFYYLMKYK